MLKLTLFITSALLLTCFLYFKKEALACEVIPLTHFEQLAPDVFIDDSLSWNDKLTLTRSLDEAKRRVTEVYGQPEVAARFIVTKNQQFSTLGLNPTGMQNTGFFRECIFLGPKGINTDVIAHELVHAEVRNRTSFWVELTELPAWFIEGTAIKVDHRAPFLPENFDVTEHDIAEVKKIFFLYEFPSTNIKYYQASLAAVSTMPTGDLYSGLEKLNQGERFQDVFRF
ncbi:hypothetical protein ACSLBF_11040 [Pseudoalteromonas sp. T1lg65]|uniref:hypothetical protein n=1 Tax=Pseudoalteromonas sp. T1lg65 TaxID=2077101 RepID=UPI003F7B0DA2